MDRKYRQTLLACALLLISLASASLWAKPLPNLQETQQSIEVATQSPALPSDCTPDPVIPSTFSFPYPYGKTRINPSNTTAAHQVNPAHLRYLSYDSYYSIYDLDSMTPLLTVHHLGNNQWSKLTQEYIHLLRDGRIRPEEIASDLALADVLPSELVDKARRETSLLGMAGASPRAHHFAADTRLKVYERIGHKDYHDVTNTFSRGHLTPSGDFKVATLSKATFMTSNIAPQVQESFNDGIWNNLEDCVRKMAAHREGVTVITGVVHENLSTAPYLNDKVAIPSHFYKIVIDETNSRPSVSAFLMENRSYGGDELDLDQYLVSVEEIEQRTGVKFFISFPESLRMELIRTKTTTLWNECL